MPGSAAAAANDSNNNAAKPAATLSLSQHVVGCQGATTTHPHHIPAAYTAVPHTTKETQLYQSDSLIVAVTSMQGWRDEMEDAYCVVLPKESVLDRHALGMRAWRDGLPCASEEATVGTTTDDTTYGSRQNQVLTPQASTVVITGPTATSNSLPSPHAFSSHGHGSVRHHHAVDGNGRTGVSTRDLKVFHHYKTAASTITTTAATDATTMISPVAAAAAASAPAAIEGGHHHHHHHHHRRTSSPSLTSPLARQQGPSAFGPSSSASFSSAAGIVSPPSASTPHQQHPFTTTVSLLGVFDGHGGAAVSETVARLMPAWVNQTHAFTTHAYEKALHDAFVVNDKLLHRQLVLSAAEEARRRGQTGWANNGANGSTNGADIDNRMAFWRGGGSTANVVMIVEERSAQITRALEDAAAGGNVVDGSLTGNLSSGQSLSPATSSSGPKTATDTIRIICANAGDSRAILVRANGLVVPLSEDHSPHLPAERARIEAAGAMVFGGRGDKGWRIDGILAVCRGFGDYDFKSRQQIPFDKQQVVATPDVRMTFVHRDVHGRCSYPYVTAEGIEEEVLGIAEAAAAGGGGGGGLLGDSLTCLMSVADITEANGGGGGAGRVTPTGGPNGSCSNATSGSYARTPPMRAIEINGPCGGSRPATPARSTGASRPPSPAPATPQPSTPPLSAAVGCSTATPTMRKYMQQLRRSLLWPGAAGGASGSVVGSSSQATPATQHRSRASSFATGGVGTSNGTSPSKSPTPTPASAVSTSTPAAILPHISGRCTTPMAVTVTTKPLPTTVGAAAIAVADHSHTDDEYEASSHGKPSLFGQTLPPPMPSLPPSPANVGLGIGLDLGGGIGVGGCGQHPAALTSPTATLAPNCAFAPPALGMPRGAADSEESSSGGFTSSGSPCAVGGGADGGLGAPMSPPAAASTTATLMPPAASAGGLSADTSNQRRPPPLPTFVIHPSRLCTPLFIVLACDGIWDCLTNNELTKLLLTGLDKQLNRLVVGLQREGVLPAFGSTPTTPVPQKGGRDPVTSPHVNNVGGSNSQSVSPNTPLVCQQQSSGQYSHHQHQQQQPRFNREGTAALMAAAMGLIVPRVCVSCLTEGIVDHCFGVSLRERDVVVSPAANGSSSSSAPPTPPLKPTTVGTDNMTFMVALLKDGIVARVVGLYGCLP